MGRKWIEIGTGVEPGGLKGQPINHRSINYTYILMKCIKTLFIVQYPTLPPPPHLPPTLYRSRAFVRYRHFSLYLKLESKRDSSARITVSKCLTMGTLRCCCIKNDDDNNNNRYHDDGCYSHCRRTLKHLSRQLEPNNNHNVRATVSGAHSSSATDPAQ